MDVDSLVLRLVLHMQDFGIFHMLSSSLASPGRRKGRTCCNHDWTNPWTLQKHHHHLHHYDCQLLYGNNMLK